MSLRISLSVESIAAFLCVADFFFTNSSLESFLAASKKCLIVQATRAFPCFSNPAIFDSYIAKFQEFKFLKKLFVRLSISQSGLLSFKP